MPAPTPTAITADREAAALTIEWDTGESFAYPFGLLRNACPCAQCRGGHENMKSEPDEDVFIIPLMDANTSKLLNLEAVGSYAITITWGDGHSHGIYNWEYLYSLGMQMNQKSET